MKKLRPCSGRCHGRADNTQHLNLGHVELWLLVKFCDPERLDPCGLQFPQLYVAGVLVCSLNGGGEEQIKVLSSFQAHQLLACDSSHGCSSHISDKQCPCYQNWQERRTKHKKQIVK